VVEGVSGEGGSLADLRVLQRGVDVAEFNVGLDTEAS
jgi:hypothetical protein